VNKITDDTVRHLLPVHIRDKGSAELLQLKLGIKGFARATVTCSSCEEEIADAVNLNPTSLPKLASSQFDSTNMNMHITTYQCIRKLYIEISNRYVRWNIGDRVRTGVEARSCQRVRSSE
jgi:hypothetical protein